MLGAKALSIAISIRLEVCEASGFDHGFITRDALDKVYGAVNAVQSCGEQWPQMGSSF